MTSCVRKGRADATWGGRSRGIRAFVVAVGLILSGPALAGQASAAPDPRPGKMSDADVTTSLDFLAKNLAAATAEDAGLRKTIFEAVEKRFDGDENALWSSLAARPDFSRKVAGPSQDDVAIAGGLCRLKGKSVIVIDARASAKERIRTLVQALKPFDLTDVYIPPPLRELLEKR